MLNEFKNLCVKEGIRRELTTPHNPHQNGVVERNIHSIFGATRVMLHDQGLPLHLWDEACNTTVHLKNRSPYRTISMITLEKYFSVRMSNVSHFNILGASIYYHISKESRKKLEMTTKLVVFVAYTETPHKYHVYLPSIKMIAVQRDVKFTE